MRQVTLILRGADEDGVPILAELLEDFLLAAGCFVSADPMHGPKTPRSMRAFPLEGVQVSIIEVESTDTGH